MTCEKALYREFNLSRKETYGQKKKTPVFTSRMEKREYFKGTHFFDIRNVVDLSKFLKEIKTHWNTYVSQVNILIQQNPIKQLVLTGIFTIVLGLSAIHTSAAIVPEYTYQVNAGEKIETIAQAHGVTVHEIYAANGISALNSGQKILLPKVEDMSVTADTLNIRSQPTVQSSVVGYLKKGTTVKVSFIENGWAAIMMEGRIRYVSADYLGKNAGADSIPAGSSSAYTVKPGDTFFKISQALGVSVSSIQELNPGVEPAKLKVGQSIRIPSTAARTQGNNEAGKINDTSVYVVKSGDTIYNISKTLGVSVSSIQELNPTVHPAKLKIGQTIHIPIVTASEANHIKVEAQIIDADSRGTFLFTAVDGSLHSATASGVLLNELIEHKGEKLLLTLKAKRGQEMNLTAIH